MLRAAALGKSYRRIANSLLNSRPHEHGGSNGFVGAAFSVNQCCRECGTMQHSGGSSRGRNMKLAEYDNLGCKRSSSTMIMQMQIINALRLGKRSRASSLLLDLSHEIKSLKAADLLDIFDYCASTPDPLFVMETWRLMQEKEIHLSNRCYGLMVKALCNSGYLEEASQLICYLEENCNFYKNLPVYNIFLDACARVRSIHHANQCLDLMEHRMIGKNEITYTVLLKMQDLGVHPTPSSYDGFVRAMVFQGDTQKGMEILKLMKARNIKPLNSTLGALSIGFSRDLELDKAEELLNNISAPRYPHPFNSFLAACDKKGQPERAIRMLKKMNRLKIQPDIVTYQIMFSQLGKINVPYECGDMHHRVDLAKRINALEIDMAKNGIQHSHISIIKLLRALGAGGMIRQLLLYFRVAEDLFFHDDTSVRTPIYNTLLDQLVKNNEIRIANEVFKNMKLKGVAPDAGTYNLMVTCCGIIRSCKSALAFISMMIRDGVYPEASTYAILIKILLEDESFSKAMDLVDQAVSEGYLYVSLYNIILNKAHKKRNVDVIEFVVEHMNQRKIQPDPETIEYVFTAYVECGYHATAVEALMVLSMRMLCEEDAALKESMAGFENFIYNEDLDPESLIPQYLRKFEDGRACALLNLRWCAVMGSPISCSTSESPWAKRLVANFHHVKFSSTNISCLCFLFIICLGVS